MDQGSDEYQRLTWDALTKSITRLVNKVNADNIKNIIPELFAENLIRGRGLFCRSCINSQAAFPSFTDVYAAVVAVLNTKFPEIGIVLLRRLILQFQIAYKHNDKPKLVATVKFIAHLANQNVVNELIALELLTLLLEKPTNDSVELAVGFVTECGSLLLEVSPHGLHGVFERFHGILHKGEEIDNRVLFLIEDLFELRIAKFEGYPAICPELDLVEKEDQWTHVLSLADKIDPQIAVDIFKPDPDFVENEIFYEELKKDILGEKEKEEEDDQELESESESDLIKDEPETNLMNLRRSIYLTIMSSVDFEETGQKLLKILKTAPGQEMELCTMLLECCSNETTYLRYYGLLGQRFCTINEVYRDTFKKCFVQQYSTIQQLETNKIRKLAMFFAHLLATNALTWHVLAYIRLTKEDTTSSSRIFIKFLFKDLSEQLGIRLLNERLSKDSFDKSIFPKDNPINTRFAINYFTSIGLDGITENLRDYYTNMQRLVIQQQNSHVESESAGSKKRRIN
ncbi:hypothetical protein ABFS82_10G007400 [Erythranthe guttata]|uniref:MI domain-containing protein n=1 Tax=Erythranthe guttata TaxID=4155 RepID=A0A022RSV4_ERYGU|nr:PREDICTED: pre-mRNA-splicing factor cwc22-like [Erythranthe guttata]EYU41985.1 hypothetical protein MIMGU_mgv1a018267mg [Erythranthe guttata]|eukprot:XP_012831852.1 PREDICTED: pre-mRNA-splicing factor cwc22-like [Erythranthe guttata]